MAEVGEVPATPSNKSTSQQATGCLSEPSDEASSPSSSLPNSFPDSAFDEALLSWDMHVPFYEALDDNIMPAVAQVLYDFVTCFFCGRYFHADLEACPDCGPVQYSTLCQPENVQHQSQAQVQETTPLSGQSSNILPQASRLNSNLLLPLMTTDDDSSWLDFLMPDFDLPDGAQNQDILAVPRVEFQVLDELVFDIHMNPVPNPRRKRRHLLDGEREQVAMKRGKVCGGCKRRHAKCEHVVAEGGRAAGLIWVCPAYKLFALLSIRMVADPIYIPYQRDSLCPRFSTQTYFRLQYRDSSHFPLDLAINWVSLYCDRPPITFHSVCFIGVNLRSCLQQHSIERKVEEYSYSYLEDLEAPDPSRTEPRHKLWSMIILEAAHTSLVQSAREARGFVSHGRGAPWTLIFRDLFTRGQSHHS